MHPNLHHSVKLLPACLCIAATTLHAQTLEVTPSNVMIDEPATIRVTGLQPHQHAILQAELVGGGGAPWSSQAEFAADETGTIDCSKQAPVKGSYHTVSALGLIWSMKPDAKGVHMYQPPRGLGPQTTTFHLIVDGKPLATAQLQQMAIADGVQQVQLPAPLYGVFFLPNTPGQHPGVLVVGGSEGGMPIARAAWLASHGYAAVALAYFRSPGLPPQLEDIPLEYFGQALNWMMQRPEIAPDQLAVMGTSRGGELALQLGSMYSPIHAVVAYVPANVRYRSCCTGPPAPAWTWLGKGLAYAIPRSTDFANQTAATIHVELTKGPILVISGQDDGVWPSQSMMEDVMHRLQQAHFAYRFEHLNYPHAGHLAGRPEIVPTWFGQVQHPVSGMSENFGGTPEGNAESSLDAIPKVIEFLQQAFPNAATK